MLEGRKAQFIEELINQDVPRAAAQKELALSVDRLVHYAGWCDKYQQLFGTVNPVASSHFNFSVPEPTGVVAAVVPQDTALLGLVSIMAPLIAGGNACILLASETKPLCSVTFAEVLNSSDLPGGVVNILTGKPSELTPQFAAHMDVNAVIFCGDDAALQKDLQEKSAGNVKRVHIYNDINWTSDRGQSPYFIMDAQEIKTTWHPVENTGGGGGKY
jgi:acyl-CoA reductase-like NAD-dependent aldehyde dehydrogenase